MQGDDDGTFALRKTPLNLTAVVIAVPRGTGFNNTNYTLIINASTTHHGTAPFEKRGCLYVILIFVPSGTSSRLLPKPLFMCSHTHR